MKRLIYTLACTLLCTFCGPYVHRASAQHMQTYLRQTTHQERAEHRAQRLADYQKFIDSLVLSHNFEFQPESVQLQPAGEMNLISNPNYLVMVWNGQMDVCLPYYTGVVPPYRYTLLNTGSPSLTDYITQQTDNGWRVSFKTVLYAELEYTFVFDITSHGAVTLTITNDWYNPVQYTGDLTKIY